MGLDSGHPRFRRGANGVRSALERDSGKPFRGSCTENSSRGFVLRSASFCGARLGFSYFGAGVRRFVSAVPAATRTPRNGCGACILVAPAFLVFRIRVAGAEGERTPLQAWRHPRCCRSSRKPGPDAKTERAACVGYKAVLRASSSPAICVMRVQHRKSRANHPHRICGHAHGAQSVEVTGR